MYYSNIYGASSLDTELLGREVYLHFKTNASWQCVLAVAKGTALTFHAGACLESIFNLI